MKIKEFNMSGAYDHLFKLLIIGDSGEWARLCCVHTYTHRLNLYLHSVYKIYVSCVLLCFCHCCRCHDCCCCGCCFSLPAFIHSFIHFIHFSCVLTVLCSVCYRTREFPFFWYACMRACRIRPLPY